MITETENTQYTQMTSGDYQGGTYSNKDVFTVVYSDEQYTYTVSASLPLDELIEIAKSIQKK